MNLREAKEQDYEEVKKLYMHAFPSDERTPFFLLTRRLKEKKAVMMVGEEDNQFIGFAYLMTNKDLAYLFFFAINDVFRRKGYGHMFLQQLIQHYKGRRLLLASEQVVKNAPNYEERVERNEFYHHNGFKDLPFKIKEVIFSYDAMSVGGSVAEEEYLSLIKEWAGPLFSYVYATKPAKKNES